MLKDYFWSLALVAVILGGYSAIVFVKKSNSYDLHSERGESHIEALRSSASLKPKSETQAKPESNSAGSIESAPVND